ncbi:MAG: hypothetical protein SXG53_11910 [Pseudomonadota bacterium]|nr:hypothetical protein [Pseudomonadota bacterium]
MTTVLAAWLALGVSLSAHAATLLETSQVLAVDAEAAALVPAAREFTLTAAGNYTVTLQDLGVPAALRGPGDLSVAPLQSLQALVARDLQSAAELEITYPAAPNQLQQPATLSFAGTPGTYRVHVLGALATGEAAGLFSITVAPSGGGAAVFTSADTIESASGPAPGQSVLRATFPTELAGTYRVRALDRAFPSALNSRDVLVLQTSPTTRVAVNSSGQPFSPADAGTFNANAGDVYELIVIASAGASTAGLFGTIVQGGPSDAVLYSSEHPVGQLPPAHEFNVVSAGTHALTLADLQFPQALQSFSAAVVQGNAFAGSATGASPANLTLSAGPAQLFVYATTADTGALSAMVSQGAQVDYSDVHIVDASPAATTPAIYSFTPPQPVGAGNYVLAVEDLDFPTSLASIEAAVIQGATLVHRSVDAGSDQVSLQAGPVRLLIAATPPPAVGSTPGNGVFTVSLQAAPGNASVLESIQGVGGLFTARSVNVPVTGRYDIALKDFDFPVRLRTSWLAITRGTSMVGQVIGSTAIQNLQLEAGTHVLNFLGQPAANESYGTFGMKVADSVPLPLVTLTASSASVTSGQSATLQWSATNATSCIASGGWSGSKASSGTQQTAALTTNATFELECVGPGGRGNASVAVAVSAASSASGKGGGGHMDLLMLVSLLALLAAARASGRRCMTK